MLFVEVFGDKRNHAGVAHQVLLIGPGGWDHESQRRGPIGRRDFDPAVARSKAHVRNQVEAHLLKKELLASFLVAHVNVREMQAQIGAHSAGARARALVPERVLSSVLNRDDPVGEPPGWWQRIIVWRHSSGPRS